MSSKLNGNVDLFAKQFAEGLKVIVREATAEAVEPLQSRIGEVEIRLGEVEKGINRLLEHNGLTPLSAG